MVAVTATDSVRTPLSRRPDGEGPCFTFISLHPYRRNTVIVRCTDRRWIAQALTFRAQPSEQKGRPLQISALECVINIPHPSHLTISEATSRRRGRGARSFLATLQIRKASTQYKRNLSNIAGQGRLYSWGIETGLPAFRSATIVCSFAIRSFDGSASFNLFRFSSAERASFFKANASTRPPSA